MIASPLGMVVFRIKGDNDLTERLLKRMNQRGHLHCVPASLKGKYVIRFTVTSTRTTNDDILSDWAEIRQITTEILEELNINLSDRAKVPLKGNGPFPCLLYENPAISLWFDPLISPLRSL